LGLAFAPQVKFVKKCKGQAAAETTGREAAAKSQDRFDDKTESASESDAESFNDSSASSDDEQETGRQKERETTGVADFKASVSEYGDEDDDDELLVKKTGRSDRLHELQDSNKAVVKPSESQVLFLMFVIIMMYTHTCNQFPFEPGLADSAPCVFFLHLLLAHSSQLRHKMAQVTESSEGNSKH